MFHFPLLSEGMVSREYNSRRNQLQRKTSLPHIADALLLYSRQGLNAPPTPFSISKHIACTIVVDGTHGTPELNRRFDETGEPEDEHDEGEEEDVDGQQKVSVVECYDYGHIEECYDRY